MYSFDDSVERYIVPFDDIFFIFRLVGVFRMVLQKLIQDGHLEVRESLIDMNNTVLKVRLECRKKKMGKVQHKKKCNKYGLLTKCEVKMAGYWPSSFLRVYGPRRSRGP